MPYIILDRDGVINQDSDDYVKSEEEWMLIPESDIAISKMNNLGFTVLVSTNQSGVARGYYSLQTLDAMHQKMNRIVEQAGGEIQKTYFCPHGPDDGCDCRKPKTGMIDQARSDFPDLGNPWFVGDSLRDLQCARDSSCQPILVKTGKGERTLEKGLDPDLKDTPVFDNLNAFADWLATQSK